MISLDLYDGIRHSDLENISGDSLKVFEPGHMLGKLDKMFNKHFGTCKKQVNGKIVWRHVPSFIRIMFPVWCHNVSSVVHTWVACGYWCWRIARSGDVSGILELIEPLVKSGAEGIWAI